MEPKTLGVRLFQLVDVLDAQLNNRTFIAIDSFSVADISALVLIDFIAWVKIVPGEGRPNLVRWHQAMSQRPCASA